MVVPSTDEITGLLHAWRSGDEQALEKLMPLVYDELRRAARRYMAGERTDHTLQTTALVNEVYLRLVDLRRIDWQNRSQFLAICAQMMRRVLTDFARSRHYQKRGGDTPPMVFDEGRFGCERGSDLAALDDALNTLATVDQRKSKVVELRFFGGLSVKETAEVLQVSSETVMRDWKLAKVWLLRELSGEARA
jgi:RNA polymerase sigma-70 factor, ECF subfamily